MIQTLPSPLQTSITEQWNYLKILTLCPKMGNSELNKSSGEKELTGLVNLNDAVIGDSVEEAEERHLVTEEAGNHVVGSNLIDDDRRRGKGREK